MFGKRTKYSDGLEYLCKECKRKDDLSYRRTVNGLITQIYSRQKSSSIKRGHPKPDYSKKELHNWIVSNVVFLELWKSWVVSGFNNMEKPSVDRLDDSVGYTFSNIQLVTWRENLRKARLSSRTPIAQIKDGEVVHVYKSATEACMKSGVCQPSITFVCRGKRKSAGGFQWRYI